MPAGPSQTLFRLEELASQCQRVLETLALEDEDNRRVRWEPNARLLRYYTTLGLLDRAEQMVGRTAYYGRKHLLQLLAIKKLQKDGHSLQQIQEMLLGQQADDLERLLALPPDWEAQWTAPDPQPPPENPAAPRDRFWEQPPQALPPPPLAARTVLELQVAPGLTLRIDPEQFDLSHLPELQRALQRFQKEKTEESK